jgi:anti-sigma B factor antagonist
MDFANVEYISSGGLRVLLVLEQLMEDRGCGLRLTHVNANNIEIFELVGFMDVVRVDRD